MSIEKMIWYMLIGAIIITGIVMLITYKVLMKGFELAPKASDMVKRWKENQKKKIKDFAVEIIREANSDKEETDEEPEIKATYTPSPGSTADYERWKAEREKQTRS